MCDGDRLRWAVAVLAQNQVCLATTRIVALECIRAMQEYDHIRILFERVVNRNPLCYKAISAGHSSIVHILLSNACDLDNPVPEHVIRRQVVNLSIFEHRRCAMEPGSARPAL